MMPVDNDLKQMVRELGQALARALSTAPTVADAVRRIRHQGCSLYLAIHCDAVDCGDESVTKIELNVGKANSKKPVFLLNKDDVSFLESVGIDPTRSGGRRRSG